MNWTDALNKITIGGLLAMAGLTTLSISVGFLWRPAGGALLFGVGTIIVGLVVWALMLDGPRRY